MFALNVPLLSVIFLKRSLFPFYYFPLFFFFLPIDHCRRLYLSLFFGTLYSDGSIFPFLLALPLASLIFSAICKSSFDNYFAFLHFFVLGMVLIPASCTMSHTSIHSSIATLSIRSIPLNLFVTSTV